MTEVRGEESVALSKNDLVALYRRRARNYDLTANVYYLIGYREWAYRKRAVAALQLGLGDDLSPLER